MPSLLDALAIFDWVSPAAAAVQDLANGPSHTLFIPVGSCTGGEIAADLSAQGIASWGHMTVNGQHMITVRQADAERAEAIVNQGATPSGSPFEVFDW